MSMFDRGTVSDIDEFTLPDHLPVLAFHVTSLVYGLFFAFIPTMQQVFTAGYDLELQ
jgi:hypothetical protein